jgi:hypothetical protein
MGKIGFAIDPPAGDNLPPAKLHALGFATLLVTAIAR